MWLTSFIAYPLLCQFQGDIVKEEVDFYQAAYGPGNPPEQPGADTPERFPVQRRNPWYLIAVACLVAILGIAGWSWLQGVDATAHLDTFQVLIVVPTVLYFIAATLWMKKRRAPRTR